MAPWLLIQVLGTLFVALALHEAGHLLAGRVVGFRFGLFAVGPLCVARTGDRLSLRWLPPSHWGPFALSYPLTAERISVRAAWCVAGGPLASLLLALMSVAWMWAMPGPETHRYGAMMALTSACVFIATAQPFGTGAGVPSDGGRVWALLRGGSAARSAAALLALNALDEAGVRPRDWDPPLVELAARVEAPPAYSLSSATLMLRWARDMSDEVAAQVAIDRIRLVYSQVPRWLRAEAAAEAAFWLAYAWKEVGNARAFLRDARGPLVARHRVLRAESAVLLRSGDLVAAGIALDGARAALRQGFGDPSSFDIELIEEVGREVNERRRTV